MSLNVRNGNGFLEEVVFNLDLEGSGVFEQLEMGFKGIPESLKCTSVLWGYITVD